MGNDGLNVGFAMRSSNTSYPRNEPIPNEPLTQREREVLRLAEQGLTNNQIGRELGLNRNAVRFHLKGLHAKLGTDGERAALSGGSGQQKRWSWAWLTAFATGGFATNAAAAGAVVAISVAGYAGVRAAHRSHQVSEDAAPRIITVNAWDGATAADFGLIYQTTASQILQLNPELDAGPYTRGQTIRVPVPPGATLAEAAPTP